MQTPPSTPASTTVAPGAPLRPRLIKRPKSTMSSATPTLAAEDKAALLPKLRALRATHAPRAFELAQVALEALHELQALDEAMDEEARVLYPRYVHDLHDYKLTFQHEYPERAELYDDKAPFLEDVIRMVEDIETEAVASLPHAAAAAAVV
jgi:hypothetical protein